jgi:hypothetical protein
MYEIHKAVLHNILQFIKLYNELQDKCNDSGEYRLVRKDAQFLNNKELQTLGLLINNLDLLSSNISKEISQIFSQDGK